MLLRKVWNQSNFAGNNSQHFLIVPWSPKRSATMLDPFAQLFQHCWGREDLWVVSIPRCTVGPNIVGSCCICLHTIANMHATTPNIVGATMLGVVASISTQPKTPGKFLTWFWTFLLKRKKIPTQGSNEEFRIPMSLSHHYTYTITPTRQNSEKFKYIPKGVVLAPFWSENRYRFFPFQSGIGYGLYWTTVVYESMCSLPQL